MGRVKGKNQAHKTLVLHPFITALGIGKVEEVWAAIGLTSYMQEKIMCRI